MFVVYVLGGGGTSAAKATRAFIASPAAAAATLPIACSRCSDSVVGVDCALSFYLYFRMFSIYCLVYSV